MKLWCSHSWKKIGSELLETWYSYFYGGFGACKKRYMFTYKCLRCNKTKIINKTIDVGLVDLRG